MNEGDWWNELAIEARENSEVDGITALWRGVIVQVILDAKSGGNGAEARKARAQAKAWLAESLEDSDFALVCELAGLDPSRVRKAVKEILQGKRRLAFHCLRKGRPHRKRRKMKIQLTKQGELYEQNEKTNEVISSGQCPSGDLDESI